MGGRLTSPALRTVGLSRQFGTVRALERNLEIDFEDVKHLARSRDLDLALLEARYKDELRPYVSGPVERHDETLRLWIDAIREERGEGTPPD